MNRAVAFVAITALSGVLVAGQTPTPADPQPAAARLDALKRGIAADVDGMRVMTQQMTDMVFSFGELGFQEVETSKYLTGVLEQHGFTVERGVAGMPDGVDGALGIGQAGDRARLGHRRHPAGVAEARRRLPRSDRRRRSRPRRRAQQRPAAADHRGAGAEARDGAREAVRHAGGVARRRRGAARRQGLPGARRRLQGRRRLPLRPRQRRPGRALGRGHGVVGSAVDRVHVHRRDRALGGRAVARPLRARRRRADERRLELPPRAPPPAASVALRDHERRRSAQRGAAQRQRLVLPARDRLTTGSSSCAGSPIGWPRAPRS